MAKSRKVLRIVKWAVAACCLILLVAWPLSPTRVFGYAGDLGAFLFDHGTIGVGHIVAARGAALPGFTWGPGYPSRWLGEFSFSFSRATSTSVPTWFAKVPIWFALSISAALTALLFYLDRKRIPPGHCQSCGYDLTGNVSGVCSECGEGVD